MAKKTGSIKEVKEFISKKKKPSNPSTPPETLAKTDWWEYTASAAFRFFPGKDEWRQRLIYSMYQFLEEKDSKGRDPIDVMQFCRSYKIPYETLNNYVNAYPDVAKAYSDMKLYLASNRRVGAMHKELDKEAVYKDQHRYDPSWDEVNKYHAALKNDEAQNETKVVVIERMPTSKMVPEKKK